MPFPVATGQAVGLFPSLAEDALLGACRIEGTVGLRPHPTQSLQGLRAAFRAFWREPAGACRTGAADSVIVLAIDGLGYSVAKGVWSSPDLLLPLTSTFPSVSGTAWLTAATGLAADEHLVPGVVFRRPERGSLYHAYQDRDLAQEGERPRRAGTGLHLPRWPTFFDDLRGDGIDAVALPGDMGPWPPPLKRAVLSSARGAGDEVPWERLRYRPREMAAAVVREVDAALAARRGRPLFLWAYVNVDDAIHRSGYDADVEGALRKLEAAACGWQARGHTVVAHGDHGLVPFERDGALAAAFAAAAAADLCRLPPGGAGRVLWAYPRPGREGEVLARLGEALAGCALVAPAAELAALGLFPWNAALAARLGEVCAVATAANFPAPAAPGVTFEHGSFTAGEMLTAFAVWGG